MAKAASKQKTKPLLTDREYEVIELVGEGMTSRQIGKKLGISDRTVENHLSFIFIKLEVDNRVQAAVAAGALINGHNPRNRQSPDDQNG